MYEITITEKTLVDRTEEDYQVIEQRPLTREEMQNAYSEEDYKGQMKDVHGYVERTCEKLEETEIFKQTVDELDLSAVIRAVNGL